MKKIVSGFLAVCTLLTSFQGAAVVSAAADTKADDSAYTASVTFGTKNIMQNVSEVSYAGSTLLSYSNNKEVVKLDMLNGDYRQLDKNGHIYIDISDSFFCGNTDGSEFLVTVDYVDSNKTDFNVKYDKIGGEEGVCETVYAGTTNLIKSHTYTIKDANFANGHDGYDLEIGFPDTWIGTTAKNVMIAGVTIERIPGKNPILTEIKSDVTGNIFNYEDVPAFTETLTSYSAEEQTVTVKRTAANKLGNIEWEATEELTLAPGEVKQIETKPEIKTYGLYYYTVEISNDVIDYTKETQFSYVNTPQDGLFNDRFGYSIHLNTEHSEEVLRDEIEAVLKSGTRSTRDNITWAWNESGSQGNYHMGHVGPVLDLANEYGLNSVWIAASGNTLYTKDNYTFPATDDAAQAFVNFYSYVIDTYGINQIELWNEPNLTSFAAQDQGVYENTWTAYADFVKKVASKLKEKYPDLKIGALSLCGLTSTEELHHTRSFTQAIIDNGAYKYIDAVSFHPYYANSGPELGTEVEACLSHAQMVIDAGVPNLKIWNTEIGWTVAKDGKRDFTDRQQSAWHQRYFILWDEHPELGYYHLYDFMKDGNIREEREHQFGIVDNIHYPENGIPLMAREAYVTLTNMNNVIAGCNEHPTKVETGIDKIYAYKYRNDERGHDILTFWREEEITNETIHVNLGTNKVRLVDSYGNEVELESENGEYDFVPDFELSYVIGDFNSVSITKSQMSVSELNINAIPNDMISVDISGVSGIDSVGIREDNFVELDASTQVSESSIHANVNMPDLREEKTSFWLLLKDGEKIRSAVRIYLDKSEIFNTNLSISLKTKEYTNWNGYLSIKNNSQRNIIDGEVKMVEVGGEELSYKSVYTGPIPAGKTAQVEVPLPRVFERNMKEIKYELQLSDGTVYDISDTANFAFAPYAETAPTIDGKWDKGEWADNTSFEVNQKSQIKKITDWAGKDDLSAVIYTAWDYDNFYITAQVKDDVFCQKDTGVSVWQGDSLQFGLVYGEETNIQIGNFGTKYSEFGAAKTPEGDQMYRWMSEDGSKSEGFVENYELAITRDDETQLTTYEMEIPWSEILPKNIKSFDPNRALGFSLLVNDNDGSGRRGWIEYASGIGEGKNTSLFTYLNLIKVE